MITAIWDNGGKDGKNEERYTISKSGRIYVIKPDGTWDCICNDTPFEIDKAWMDKNQTLMDFSQLPVMVQKAAEEAVYP